MKKKIIFVIVLLCIVALAMAVVAKKYFSVRLSPTPSSLDFLLLPPGFNARIFADGFGNQIVSTPGPNMGARLMEIKNDTVFVSVPSEGKVYALPDADKNFIADEKKIFMDGLNNPHGIALWNEWVYIAEEARVFRVKDTDGDNHAEKETLEVLTTLPAGGHFTRTIRIFNDKLYISIGSSCNVCNESNPMRASIQECDLEGKNCSTFASGLRNTVGFIEYNGKIYGTDNGRDWLGDSLPPDELNIIEKGRNYGWPICYGHNVLDEAEHPKDRHVHIRAHCTEPFETPSFVDLDAHVAPLGLTVYTGKSFPKEYQGKIFVALHGSWNASSPVGYKVVTVNPKTREVKDFATGFLGNGVVYGRPVDIINFRDGLLVSDDNKGKIYRISYEKQ